MRGRELDFVVLGKHAFPFGFGFFKQGLDALLEFAFRAGVAKFQRAFAVLPGGHFVVELGEDELEKFLENVHTGIGQNFVLHFQNQILERFAFGDELVAIDEIVEGELLIDDFRERLVGIWQVGEVVEIIRVFAVVKRILLAV